MTELERIQSEAIEVLRQRLEGEAKAKGVILPASAVAIALTTGLGSVFCALAGFFPGLQTKELKKETDKCLGSSSIDEAQKHLGSAKRHLWLGF